MTNTYTISVAAEVRAEMARQRLSQRKVAIKLGWSQQMLSTRLLGTVPFSTTDLAEIASALGVEVTQLASPVQR